MKVNKLTLTIALLAAAGGNAIATDFYLTDGSILSGYLADQSTDPKAKWTIVTDAAYIVLPDSTISGNYVKEFRQEGTLPDTWKEWAEKNNAWEYQGKKRGLYFATISTKERNFNNVHVLAEGSPFEIVDFQGGSFKVNGNDIVTMTETPRTPEVLSGLNRQFYLDKQTIVGELVETNTKGKYYTVIDENGTRQNIARDKISSWQLAKFNPDQTLFEQAEYLDKVITKDDKEYTGLIIGQDFKDKNITIRTQGNDSAIQIPTSKVKNLCKVTNPGKNIKQDVILKDGEMQINGHAVGEFMNLSQYPQGYYLSPNTEKKIEFVEIPAGHTSDRYDGKLILYASSSDKTGDLGTLELIKVSEIPANVIGLKKVNDPVYGIDLIKAEGKRAKAMSCETSRNGTIKVVYNMPERGKYFVYNPVNKTCLLIEIK